VTTGSRAFGSACHRSCWSSVKPFAAAARGVTRGGSWDRVGIREALPSLILFGIAGITIFLAIGLGPIAIVVPLTTASASVPVVQNPDLTIAKMADVASVDAAGEVIHYTVTVGNAGGELFAVTRRCRHLYADLAKGRIDKDGCLVCPWHASKYDVKTGRMLRAGVCRDLMHTVRGLVEDLSCMVDLLRLSLALKTDLALKDISDHEAGVAVWTGATACREVYLHYREGPVIQGDGRKCMFADAIDLWRLTSCITEHAGAKGCHSCLKEAFDYISSRNHTLDDRL